MRKELLVDFPICIDTYPRFLDQILASTTAARNSSYVCVANVHMLAEAHLDKSFAEVIRKADLVTPDGVPLTWGLRLIHGIKQERVAGADLLPDLLARAEKEQISVYFYGGSEVLLKQTAFYLSLYYPRLKVAGMHSPPYRALTPQEEQADIEAINRSNAKLVFVVLGCPKQEKWMAAMKGRVNAVMIGIGGALPILVGTQKRAPLWMQRYGLEWLFRFYLEPKRLFKRYAFTNSYFLFLLGKEFIKIRLLHKKPPPSLP